MGWGVLHTSETQGMKFTLYENVITGGAVVAHAFNPSTWEAEAGRFLGLRPAWSTKWVSGQPGLYRETLFRKKTKKNKTKMFRMRVPS